ncbi:transcriptional regulator [Kitasatospora sp. NPDC051914]|uniref:transcriptional regulator n=1 Tax=Kitasatospora sp. NPDC051914 TaxID=3154945 RepID=UPI003435DC4E
MDFASPMESRRTQLAARLPDALDDLTGPVAGEVELPLHLAWSGLRRFDLGRPRLRMGMYRIVITEGMQEDLVRFLNAQVLVELWPVLRTLVGPAVRQVWEASFPDLAVAAARSSAA